MGYFRGRGFAFPLQKRTYIMGILNVTPDSFFDGGKWNDPENAVCHALEMEKDGADLIDIGAQSTRPGHKKLSDKEELDILKTCLDAVLEAVHVPVSVDTFYPPVADYALSRGASIVNDVSGFFNPKMAEVVKKYDAGWIVMHSGKSDSDSVAAYPNGVCADVQAFFQHMKVVCADAGIDKERLCFDIGIGFGKSNDDNLALLRGLHELKESDCALLTALSCKRVIANTSGASGEDLLYGTIAADTLAIAAGTDFIRVHHVKEAKFAAKTADALTRGESHG